MKPTTMQKRIDALWIAAMAIPHPDDASTSDRSLLLSALEDAQHHLERLMHPLNILTTKKGP